MHKHTVMRPVVPTDAAKPKPRVVGGQQKKTAQVDCAALEQLVAAATTPTPSPTTPMPAQSDAPRFAHTKKRTQTGPIARPSELANGSQALPLTMPVAVEIELEADLPPSPTAPTTRMGVITELVEVIPSASSSVVDSNPEEVPVLRARRWPFVVGAVGLAGVILAILANL